MDSLSGIAGGRYGSLSVDAVLRRSALEGADRGLYAALVFGVLERLLDAQFPLLRRIEGLRESVIEDARKLLVAAEDTPLYVRHFND